jgi:SAM-dependent methyltransferase
MKSLLQNLSITLNSFKKRGLNKTFLLLVGEYWFDRRFRVNTSANSLADDTSIVGSNLPTAAPHYGTNWFILKSVFRELVRKGYIVPASTHLVDFGCGAGRALMAALLFGVGRVSGVEFSQTLCRRAEENLASFTKREKLGPDFSWEVVHADASTYPIPPSATLFFLYNPFGPPVIEIVARHILEHARATQQPVKVVYVNALHGSVFDQLGFRKLTESNQEVTYYTSS